jgi:hypothetical protein
LLKICKGGSRSKIIYVVEMVEKKNRTVIGIGMTVQGDIYTKINTDGHMITYRRGFGLFRCLIGNRIIGINNLLFDRLFHNIKKKHLHVQQQNFFENNELLLIKILRNTNRAIKHD